MYNSDKMRCNRAVTFIIEIDPRENTYFVIACCHRVYIMA